MKLEEYNNFGKPLIIYLFSCSLFLFCKKKIDLELPNEEKKIVVDCKFFNDSGFELLLTNSKGTLSNEKFNHVSGAKVEILDNNLNQLAILQENSTFGHLNYASNSGFTFTKGKTYNLKISAPNFETVYAKTNVPVSSKITNVTSSVLPGSGNISRKIQLKFKDSVPIKNYYSVEVVTDCFSVDSNISGGVDSNFRFRTKGDLATSNLKVSGFLFNTKVIYFDDKASNGNQSNPLEFIVSYEFDSLVNPTDIFKTYITLSTLSEELFRFRVSLDEFKSNQNNPIQQPFNIYSNIENGFGIFGGYSYNRFSFYTNNP